MKRLKAKNRTPVAERLLKLRQRAGDNVQKHAHYHSLVNRYQRMLMRNYLTRYRRQIQSHWQLLKQTPVLRRIARWKLKIKHQGSKVIL